jgi:type I restriction enzyme R subunit
VRVTANDGERGEQYLEKFQMNDEDIPTILTTSKKLSTGVDARNVRNIVLMRPIKSMIEFKQIIGRGTRLFEDKNYFTIYDFVKAYEHFNDPDWDGEPMDPPEPIPLPPEDEGDGEGGPTPEPDEPEGPEGTDGPDGPENPENPGGTVGGGEGPLPEPPPHPSSKIRIRLADGKERKIQHIAGTLFYGPDGKVMSPTQFIESLFGTFPELFHDEDQLRTLWSQPDTRAALLNGLTERGFGPAELAEIKKLIDAENSDLFDVLSYVAYTKAPLSRHERAESHKATILSDHDEKLQAFLDFVLAQYVRDGEQELDNDKLPTLLKAKYYSISDGAEALGGIARIRAAFLESQRRLYE